MDKKVKRRQEKEESNNKPRKKFLSRFFHRVKKTTSFITAAPYVKNTVVKTVIDPVKASVGIVKSFKREAKNTYKTGGSVTYVAHKPTSSEELHKAKRSFFLSSLVLSAASLALFTVGVIQISNIGIQPFHLLTLIGFAILVAHAYFQAKCYRATSRQQPGMNPNQVLDDKIHDEQLREKKV